MGFTIAFFTYPIALFFIYKATKSFKTNGPRNLLFSGLIIVFPVILLLMEHNNLNEIKTELIGSYVSDNDTLIIEENGYTFKNKEIQNNGQWNIVSNDELSVCLIVDQNKKIEFKITYIDGFPVLQKEATIYTKIK